MSEISQQLTKGIIPEHPTEAAVQALLMRLVRCPNCAGRTPRLVIDFRVYRAKCPLCDAHGPLWWDDVQIPNIIWPPGTI